MVRSDQELIDAFLDGDPLMSPDEVAPIMRVDSKTVTRWAAAGRFPGRPDGSPGAFRTPGGEWRIRESIVRGLLDGTLTPREVGRG
jgi:hypothetical protein